MSNVVKVVGFDPSLKNWGFAIANFDITSGKIIDVPIVGCTSTEAIKGKQVRVNSSDLERARLLTQNALETAKDALAVFVEVPVGSQSARAMTSYGICVGILGALRAQGIQFFELTPTEVKVASVGSKTATKQQMIQWATTHHPEANWPTHRKNGQDEITVSSAEHMADAIAAIYAGLASNSFQQVLPFLRGNTVNQ